MLNNQVLSTHKSRQLAERAQTRWMNKHKAQCSGKFTREFLASGIYHIRAV